MIWKKDDGALGRFLTFATDQLTTITDIELATLKIHLVIEDTLKFLLSKRLGATDEKFFDVQIGFPLLVDVALAEINNPHLVGALRVLNTARNHLSHRIESPNFIDAIKTFVCEIANMQKKKIKWSTESTEQLSLLKDAFEDAAGAIFEIAFNRPNPDN